MEWIDLAEGRCIRRFEPDRGERIHALDITPDGMFLLAAGNQVKLWDVETGRPSATLEGHRNMVTAMAVTESGKGVLTGSIDRTARLYRLPGGESLWVSDMCETSITALAELPGGRGMILGTYDGTVRILDPRTGEALFRSKGEGGEILAIRISPDGTQAYILYRHYTIGYKQYNGVVERLFIGNSAREALVHDVSALDLSPDGSILALGKDMSTTSIWVDIIEASSEKPVCEIGHVTDPVYKVALSPGGDRLVTRGGGESPVKIWDLHSGRPVQDHHALNQTSHYTSFAFMPDGERIILSSGDLVTIADLVTGMPVHSFPVDTNCALRMAITPDCRHLVTLGEETLALWELRTGRREEIRYPGFHDSAAAVAVTGDGKRIVAAYRSRGIRVYDILSGRLLKTLGSPDLPVIHMFVVPGSSRVVAADLHGKTRVFDPETGKCFRTYDWGISSIDGASLSRNGRCLANFNPDTGVRLHDLETGRCLLHFKASSKLGGIALDDRHIITGTQDHRICFWDLKSGGLCAVLYNLTRGFLWEIPPGEDSGQGWVWTDREDLIQVAEFTSDGEAHRFLTEDDPGRRDYLRVYNNRKMVIAKLRNPEEYKALAARHRAVVEGEARRFRHEVIPMLPGPSPPHPF